MTDKLTYTYDIELIFEPTGDYVNIKNYETDAETEEELNQEILHYMSIVSWKKEQD
jgi:hypothetical protein